MNTFHGLYIGNEPEYKTCVCCGVIRVIGDIGIINIIGAIGGNSAIGIMSLVSFA